MILLADVWNAMVDVGAFLIVASLILIVAFVIELICSKQD